MHTIQESSGLVAHSCCCNLLHHVRLPCSGSTATTHCHPVFSCCLLVLISPILHLVVSWTGCDYMQKGAGHSSGTAGPAAPPLRLRNHSRLWYPTKHVLKSDNHNLYAWTSTNPLQELLLHVYLLALLLLVNHQALPLSLNLSCPLTRVMILASVPQWCLQHQQLRLPCTRVMRWQRRH
jgi:hypothetical protein